MFGMGKDQDDSGKAEEIVYDLELELKNANRREEVRHHMEGRIHRLKQILRDGSSLKEYQHCGSILQGYHAFMKVMNRISMKK